jgi:single-strand DNA-binding protein
VINKVILIGYVGKDPVIKDFETGKLANFTLATTEKGFTTRDGKDIPERTEWHMITASNGLAGVIEKHVHKGSQLYIEGKLKTRSWEADGVTKHITEVVCATMKMLGGKKPESGGFSSGDNEPAKEQPAKEQPACEEEDTLPF